MELFDSIVDFYVSTSEDNRELSSLRMVSAYTRRMQALAYNGRYLLADRNEIISFYNMVKEFHEVITSTYGITFCDTVILQVAVSGSKELCRKLGSLFQMLSLEQLSVVCSSNSHSSVNFMPKLSGWAPGLQSLQILRIKFNWWACEFRELGKMNPWAGPVWGKCIAHFPNLEAVIIKTPLALVADDRSIEQEWVEAWAAPLASLRRVYLNHSFDENEGAVNFYNDIGERHVYYRTPSGDWRCENWGWDPGCRCEDPAYPGRSLSGKLTHPADRDPFISDGEEFGSDDGWESEL